MARDHTAMPALKANPGDPLAVEKHFGDPTAKRDRRTPSFDQPAQPARKGLTPTDRRMLEVTFVGPADRHHTNVEWFGNTGSASSASVISMLWEKWADIDDVGVVGVGAGLAWSGYLLRFGENS